MFDKEADFEEALVQLLLSEKGWQKVLTNSTEQDLIKSGKAAFYRRHAPPAKYRPPDAVS